MFLKCNYNNDLFRQIQYVMLVRGNIFSILSLSVKQIMKLRINTMRIKDSYPKLFILLLFL